MNRLNVEICDIERSGPVSIVRTLCENVCLYVLTISSPGESFEATVGKPCCLLFKDTDLSLSLDLEPRISVLNRFQAEITEVTSSQLLTRITLSAFNTRLHSLTTRRTAEYLSVGKGMTVTAFVKPSTIIISRVDL